MIEKKYSYFYFMIGFIFLFFFNGRYILPLAAFLAPAFLIRFLRFQKPLKGFLMLLLAFWISNIFIWQDMLPMSGLFYYFLMFMFGVPIALIFLIDKLFTNKIKSIISTLVFPSAYVIFEYMTIYLNPSGSYGSLAHTQSNLVLLQIVSVTGIWGLIFIITWIPSMINWLWDSAFERKRLKSAFLVCIIPILFIILFGQIRLSINSNSETVMVASIIADNYGDGANSDFLFRSENAAKAGAKIIFGSENSIQLNESEETEFIEKAQEIAINNNVYIGLPIQKIFDFSLLQKKVIWISPLGEILFTYYKSKPTTGEGDYGNGKIQYFDSIYGRIGSVICFDLDFPSLISQVSEMDIDIMLIPGNDWYEISPYHTYVGSMRSIEYGFNQVRTVSKGLSASFNYKGEVLSTLDDFHTEDSTMYSNVPINGQSTIYSLLGDYFAWMCFVVLSVLTTIYFSHSKKKSKTL